MGNPIPTGTTIASKAAISSNHDSPELAAAYDEVGIRQFEQGKLLISNLNVSAGECVLDIGAGTGRLAAYVAGIVGPRGRTVAIDPLPLRIEIAKAKARGNLETRVGRAEDLCEFSSETFDVVYLNSVFHWVEDKSRALAEIFRVLRPGGRLGMSCHDPDRPHDARNLVRRAVEDAEVGLDACAVYPSLAICERELRKQLATAGFVECSCEQRTFVDIFADLDALIAWASSSTFGNFLAGVSAVDRNRVVEAMSRWLEPYRMPEGFRLERHLIFATARRAA
jgi:ubiquinone/menaquinone biosynthesis C-methylase UbiE